MYMSKAETYRLGTFLSDESRPSLEELADALDDQFIEREVEEHDNDDDLVYKDKGRNTWVQQDGREYDYCQFRYVSDTKESYRIRTEDDEEADGSQTFLETSRVLYFENGQFIMESNDDLEDFWIPRFIGRVTGYDLGDSYRFYNLGENFMLETYNSYDIVTKLKLEERNTESELSDEVGEFIQDLMSEVNSFEFSSSGNGNLKNKDSIDKCARCLGIKRMNAKHEEDLMKVFSGSSIKKSLDYEDANPENMQEQVRRESLSARDVVREDLERLKDIYG